VTFRPVTILGCGMTTAVGLTAPASCAAIRARLDGFRETRFIDAGGDWIVGAEVPLEEPWRGIPRLARLLAGPLGECLSWCPDVAPESIPVLLCLAEEDRPGRLDGLGNPLFFEACSILGVRFHEGSRLFPHGRVAGASALHAASRLLHEQGFACVIVAGVDTYLVAPTLRAMDERDRLLTPANSDGFIAGEAGAAVLVAATGEGLTVRGMGFSMEKATIESDEPLRADGLRAAFRQALASAGLAMAEIGYRIGTMSGEQYWFKEFDLATSRLLRGRHEFMDLWHPADGIGETGAASLLCCLGLAHEAARKRYAAGGPVLLTASNDDGRRAALILSKGAG
jgi:3-oxoacyl-[acyl-carrier-protein] synthase-1